MHILYDEQGSEEWFRSRLGVATASCFNQIMTTKQLKRSSSDYIYLLAAEAVSGEPQEQEFSNRHTERGKIYEPEAISWYELTHDCDVEQVGLCLMHEGSRIGFSPDGLVGNVGGVEIKCPELKTHLKYKRAGVVPDEYLHQIYGCMYVSGRSWWDFISYHKDSTPLVVRTTVADENYIKWANSFSPIIGEFIKELEEIIKEEQQQ